MFPFEIDETTDVPLWVQLRQRIAYLINSGYFKPGDKLPTVRGLASEISINYNTVNKAYLSLVSDGYLESTRGRGVFVTDIARTVGTEQFEEVEGVLDDCIASCRELGMEYDDIERAMSRKIKRLKYDEAQKLGEVPGGRIVDFEQSRMQAGMGAAGAGAGAAVEGSRAGAGAGSADMRARAVAGAAGAGEGAETRAAQVKGA